MLVKTWYPFPETFSSDLCVLPNDGESQYEAFQAIFAQIMSATYDPSKKKGKGGKKAVINESPYEMLCRKYGVKLIPSSTVPVVKPDERVVWYNPADVTHYIANVGGENINPYDKLQPNNTQGFCQMFAFFLAKEDTVGFQVADQTKTINVENFNILVQNTQTCFQKTMAYLAEDAEIQMQFEVFFNNIMNTERIEKGIKIGTTLAQYLGDFTKINGCYPCVQAYIYDQPLKGYKDSTPRIPLWFLPTQVPPKYEGEPPSYDYHEPINTMGGGKKTRRNKRRTTRKR